MNRFYTPVFSTFSLVAAKLICKSIVLCGALILFGSTSSAQIYQYTSNTGGAYQLIGSNMTATGLSRVQGAAASASPCSQGFTSVGFPSVSAWNAAAGAVQFSLTPNFGFQMTITSMNGGNARNGAGNGPLNFRFAYSLDGSTWTQMPTNQATTNLATTSCTNAITSYTWDMADFSSTTTIYFRVYPNNASSATGQHYLRNINVFGTVVSIPTGCTDPTACNYSPVAVADDGSCTFSDCMDPAACNYNAAAGCADNTICNYPGCSDPLACNYDATAACFATCEYEGDACDDGDATTNGDTWQPGCNCVGFTIGSPFNGIAVKEVAIDPSHQALVEAGLLDPIAVARTWRVYACFSDPLWELQALYSDPEIPANWTLYSSTNKFFRHPFDNKLMGIDINPAFYAFWPDLQYDSWFTFNKYDNTGVDPSYIIAQTGPGPLASDPPLPLSQWDANAGNLDINPTSSFGGCAILHTSSYPNTLTMPGGNNQVCIGQFTTDGTITANFNLQFRRMTAGGNIYLPTTVIRENNINWIAPPADSLCLQIFLPIELINFEVAQNVDRVDITWVTETEIDNELFIVERSPNGVNGWIPVNSMPGAGDSQEIIIYKSFDFAPMMGLNFYRLKQINTDGTHAYSHTEVVEFKPTGGINVFPNPSDGSVITLSGNTSELVRCVIRGVDGKIIIDQAMDENTRQIALSEYHLAKGVYLMEFYARDLDVPTVKRLIIE